MKMSEETVSADEQQVLYEVGDGIATITLNRPHRRNAITAKMLQQLGDAFLRADNDVDVRCIVLTGAGQGF
jgi:enoyl-CoA hydratase/carnithine racemase